MARGKIEVVVVWDEVGNVECGTDKDSAIERFKESISDDMVNLDGFRSMKLTLEVPLPTAIEASASFADEDESVSVTDAEISE